MDGGKQLRWFAEELAGKGRKDAVWPRRWVLGAGSCARSGWGGGESPARARVGRPRGSLAEQTRRTGGGWPGARLPAGANAPAAPEEREETKSIRSTDVSEAPARMDECLAGVGPTPPPPTWAGGLPALRRRHPSPAEKPPESVVCCGFGTVLALKR